MWEVFNERFGLGCGGRIPQHDRFALPRLSSTKSWGVTWTLLGSGQGIVLEQVIPQSRGPVLVDEAHNFRNINQRSRGLYQLPGIGRPQADSAQRHATEPGSHGHLPPAPAVPPRHGAWPEHRAGQPGGLLPQCPGVAGLPRPVRELRGGVQGVAGFWVGRSASVASWQAEGAQGGDRPSVAPSVHTPPPKGHTGTCTETRRSWTAGRCASRTRSWTTWSTG